MGTSKYTHLVGMWNDTATVEDSMAAPQKLKIESLHNSAIPILFTQKN
jgi:hypothetical protein